MSSRANRESWEVWYPKAGATGLPLARCLIDPTPAVIVHSPPEVLTAEIRDEGGRRLAYGQDLSQTQSSPMCRLRREGTSIEREDIWPTGDDVGCVVVLPGGEAGILKEWWHADDKQEWRWLIEFYNSLR